MMLGPLVVNAADQLDMGEPFFGNITFFVAENGPGFVVNAFASVEDGYFSSLPPEQVQQTVLRLAFASLGEALAEKRWCINGFETTIVLGDPERSKALEGIIRPGILGDIYASLTIHGVCK